MCHFEESLITFNSLVIKLFHQALLLVDLIIYRKHNSISIIVEHYTKHINKVRFILNTRKLVIKINFHEEYKNNAHAVFSCTVYIKPCLSCVINVLGTH